MNQALAAFAAGLGGQLGIGDLAFDDDGALVVEVGEDMPVSAAYQAESDLFLMSAGIAELSGNKHTIVDMLLDANLTPDACYGGVFTLADDGDAVILVTRVPSFGLDPELFAIAFRGFVDVAERWRSAVLHVAEADDPAAALPASITMIRV